MVNKAILNAYVRRIKRGSISINDIPEEIKEEVSIKLDKEK